MTLSNKNSEYNEFDGELVPQFISARRQRQPVIALESTILTHGLPTSTAQHLHIQLEQLASNYHVTPIHIALINGRIKLGLSPEDLHHLLHPLPPTNSLKIGRRDLPFAIAQKFSGGTTVSATMAIAHLAGIKVFATGGIGGVHRRATQTMDISSDLSELARTPVAVVCAGVKSILDIPLTLEYLETLGVPVISFSDTKEFPAFYSPKSGHELIEESFCQAPFHSSSTLECAQAIYNSDLLDLKSGTLVAVPIPNQSTDSGQVIQDAVERAVLESEKLGLNTLGKSVTPWLLNRVKELSHGKSLDANIALIKNNVMVASQIAKDYNDIILASEKSPPSTIPSSTVTPATVKEEAVKPVEEGCKMMVIGAAAMDITSRPSTDDVINPLSTGSTSSGSVQMSAGGVALNIARASHGLGVRDVMLVSQLGTNCTFGDFLLNHLASLGLRVDGIHRNHQASTGIVNMFLDRNGELLGGVADLKSLENIDYQRLLQTCHESDSVITAYEPTSVVKSCKIMKGLVGTYAGTRGEKKLTMMFPNLQELTEIHERGMRDVEELESVRYFRSIQALQVDEGFLERVRKTGPGWVAESGTLQMGLKLLPLVDLMVVKNGAKGLVLMAAKPKTRSSPIQRLFPCSNNRGDDDVQDPWIMNRAQTLCFKHFPALDAAPGPINVTGAGDSLCAAILAALATHPFQPEAAFDWDLVIRIAQRNSANLAWDIPVSLTAKGYVPGQD
ncbi:hypothetical protein VP01_560g5 [Puccinia sorghi]|uniref:Carbohydrate kinase PfkB domain-containing protein n=1 Tax=Puccinia sorghi TaxID=27349 RepID=A0A0L6UJR5_9BASI|nr:hypothetical protein VP01_560g5 [Puccinia sorghi]